MPTTLARHTEDLSHLLTPPAPNAIEVMFFIFIGAATLLPALGYSPLPVPSVTARVLIAVLCLGCLVALGGLILAAPPQLRTREVAMRITQVGLAIAAAGSLSYGLVTGLRGSVDALTTFLCMLMVIGFLWRISQISRSIEHYRRLARAFDILRADTDRLVAMLTPPTP